MKPKRTVPYQCAFDLVDERCIRALLRRAAKRPMLSFIDRLNKQLTAGQSLRDLMPKAWQPGGNCLQGGYGLGARPLAKGHVELVFSVGRGGESHSVVYEAAFGPRGGLRYYKEVGFSMY